MCLCINFAQGEKEQIPQRSILVVLAAESIDEFADVGGLADAVQVGSKAHVTFDRYALCDDVPSACLGNKEIGVVEQLQVPCLPARGLACSFGDVVSFAKRRCVNGQDAVSIRVVPPA